MKIRTREKSLHLRLTDQEYMRLINSCRKCGLKPQAYILKLIRDIRPKEAPSRDFFEVLTCLRRIGNNLRQIALKANAAGIIDADKYWKNMEELDRLVSDLKDFMLQQPEDMPQQ